MFPTIILSTIFFPFLLSRMRGSLETAIPSLWSTAVETGRGLSKRQKPAETKTGLPWRGILSGREKFSPKTENKNLPPLFVVWGGALPFPRHYLRDQSIEGIFINFPDPWPKERHAKHRLFQSEFAKETARVVSFQKGAVA